MTGRLTVGRSILFERSFSPEQIQGLSLNARDDGWFVVNGSHCFLAKQKESLQSGSKKVPDIMKLGLMRSCLIKHEKHWYWQTVRSFPQSFLPDLWLGEAMFFVFERLEEFKPSEDGEIFSPLLISSNNAHSTHFLTSMPLAD